MGREVEWGGEGRQEGGEEEEVEGGKGEEKGRGRRRRGLEGAGCWIGACPRDSGALLPPRTKGEGSF